MNSTDFEYDGALLSDYRFVICSFDEQSTNIIESGANIEFRMVPVSRGRKSVLVGSDYSDHITSTFDICKNPAIYGDNEQNITDDECRNMFRWLNRTSFHKLRFLQETEDHNRDNCYYNASFNIEKIYVRETLFGLRLTMETDGPFGYGDREVISEVISETPYSFLYKDKSDEIGYIYPDMEITYFGYPDHNEDTITIDNSMFPDEQFEIKGVKLAEGTVGGKEPLCLNYVIDGSVLSLHRDDVFYETSFGRSGGTTNITYAGIGADPLDSYDERSTFTKRLGFSDRLYRFNNFGNRWDVLVNNGTEWVVVENNVSITNSGNTYSFEDYGVYFTASQTALGDWIEISVTHETDIIGDDFNYSFVKIGNTYDSIENVYSVSVPCLIHMEYDPIIKSSP